MDYHLYPANNDVFLQGVVDDPIDNVSERVSLWFNPANGFEDNTPYE